MSLRVQRLIGLLGRDEGSNLVETAISATMFFAMLFGICQMSLAMYAYHFTAEAAREATRYAAVRGSTSCVNTPSLSNCGATNTQISDYVKGLNFPGIKSSSLTVTTTWCAASGTTPPVTWATCSSATLATPGNLVKVFVSYPLAFQIPFSKALSLNLSSTSEMVISQ